MPRAWVWLQLLIGWVPVWALFTLLILAGHPDTRPVTAGLAGLRMVVAAAALGLLVRRLTLRVPWPHPFRPGFLAIHVVAAGVFAHAWVLLNSLITSLLHWQIGFFPAPGLGPYVVLGVWVYVMVAGVSYATQATERAARAEALAARTQLAALRGQLNPHFLFNALHTVVQLIRKEPARASRAAEQVAGLLRTAIEEDRDLVPLADELGFVERYLEIERLRFAERLRVHVDVADDARAVPVPAFALQTLVENAVRHGAAPREEPTDIEIHGRVAGDTLRLRVHDTGAGASADRMTTGDGTGLPRLRERLSALYGGRARLEVETAADSGFTALLVIPVEGE